MTTATMTANITAYSAMLRPSSSIQSLRIKEVIGQFDLSPSAWRTEDAISARSIAHESLNRVHQSSTFQARLAGCRWNKADWVKSGGLPKDEPSEVRERTEKS